MPDKRRFTANDKKQIAEWILEEFNRRKGHTKRLDLEAKWKVVDRQVAMTPKLRTGGDGQARDWLPNLELPNQAETLEMLNADARRLLFADDRNFFSAHARMEDEVLERILEQSRLSGESSGIGIPDQVDQEDMDAIVEGVLTHFFSLYDLRQQFDRLNAEAFKYGTFVARVKMVQLDKFTEDFRGVKSQTFPALVPQSIKSTYLDDSFQAVMHEGMMMSPSYVYHKWQKLEDLRRAASKGSTDPDKAAGGWMAGALKDLEATGTEHTRVEVLEFEGDLLVPRTSGEPIFVPNVLMSVVIGKGGPALFRLRFMQFGFRSYLVQPYHYDDIDSPYAVGPLIKGAPIQNLLTEVVNRLGAVAALNGEPPISWTPQDSFMTGAGGPEIYPGAKWESLTAVQVHQIGDPVALFQIFQGLRQFYSDVTGMSAPRLGAQTKSHQTRFAVDAEMTRGVIRTVDYVRSMMFGSMRSFLSMNYTMLRKTLKTQPIFVPKYNTWLEIGKEMLPEMVTFDVHGAGGPLEEQETAQKKNEALQLALQIDQAKVQVGGQPMDYEAMQKVVEIFFSQEPAQAPGGVPGGVEGQPQLAGDPQAPVGIPDNLVALAATTG